MRKWRRQISQLLVSDVESHFSRQERCSGASEPLHLQKARSSSPPPLSWQIRQTGGSTTTADADADATDATDAAETASGEDCIVLFFSPFSFSPQNGSSAPCCADGSSSSGEISSLKQKKQNN